MDLHKAIGTEAYRKAFRGEDKRRAVENKIERLLAACARLLVANVNWESARMTEEARRES